ncbi:MAG: dethiobiotin synthase [Nitrospirota bacterium]
MEKGFFVTGTDTGVGKTIIAAALISILRRLSLKVCGMKPIETGCIRDKNTLVPSDGTFLRTFADMSEDIEFVTPCCFENPLAPFAASQIEGRQVDFEKIWQAYTSLKTNCDVVVIEGIGGLLVPITNDYYVLDLAKNFGLPVIITAKPGLGTLNHTMLTVRYGLKEGLVMAGVIINYSYPPENTPAEDTNARIIRRICPIPLIGTFPHLDKIDRGLIEEAALQQLDIDIIKRYL